jgi:RNA polymerase sigma-70 factor (ECF subfamily)
MEIVEFDIRILSMKERLYRLARGMLGSSTEADDAVQDVLEKLGRRRETLTGNIEALAWTTTKNHCIDRLRRRKTGITTNENAAEAWFTPSFDTRDMYAVVGKVVAALPEKQQIAIRLRDIEGCEFDEIASALGIGEAAVRAILSRARKAVREQVTKIMNYGL